MDLTNPVTNQADQASPEEFASVHVEGIDRILVPSDNLNTDLEFYTNFLGLKLKSRGPASSDPFFVEFAILEAPNGVVIELIRPKQEYRHVFSSPVFCYTVKDLRQKLAFYRDSGATAIGDLVDTHQGWGWFYLKSEAGVLCQLQGPLPGRELKSH
jgi:hypothetical protein